MSHIETNEFIDVRDLIARVEELRSEGQDIADEREDAGLEGADEAWESKEGVELKEIEAVLESLKGYGGDEKWEGDWYPVTLIRDDYFVDYARELVSDIGDMPRDIPSYIVIDWEATAKNIQMDYSSVEVDGVTYWYRHR